MSAASIALEVAAPQGSWTGAVSVDDAQRLISNAKLGDREAFAELYRVYVPFVHRFVSSRVNGAQKAEDLVAETFVRALRNITRYDFRGIEFSAWLTRIARNLIIDQSRSSASNLEILADETPETRTAADSGDLALAALDAQTLRNALSRMIPDHRRVLELRFIKGLSVAESAKLLSKTEGAVRVLQFRALRAMKRDIEKSAPELARA